MEPNNDGNKKQSRNENDKADLIDGYQKLSLGGRGFEPPPYRDTFLGFRPQYFFYGSLMDARQLRKVLQLQETPVLQAASIVGWDIMMWGHYPALIFKANNITNGVAYEVQKMKHVEYLMNYETEAYKVKGCMIKLADGRELAGKTFIWNAEKELLK
jgi:gamma-glutamylcyclotransferase (GGCT)/AIG2-like uncharacterized protein YtfP